MAPVRRLAVGLAASLALHLALLGLAPRRHAPPLMEWMPAPPLRVELRPMPAPDRPPPPRQRARPPYATEAVAVAAPTRAIEPAAAPAALAAEVPGPAPPVRLDLAALYAAARAQARQDRPPSHREETPAPEDRPILPAFARALRRETAGERRLADGLIRVVTAGGHVYCLQAPPPSDGPGNALAVPGTCP